MCVIMRNKLKTHTHTAYKSHRSNSFLAVETESIELHFHISPVCVLSIIYRWIIIDALHTDNTQRTSRALIWIKRSRVTDDNGLRLKIVTAKVTFTLFNFVIFISFALARAPCSLSFLLVFTLTHVELARPNRALGCGIIFKTRSLTNPLGLSDVCHGTHKRFIYYMFSFSRCNEALTVQPKKTRKSQLRWEQNDHQSSHDSGSHHFSTPTKSKRNGNFFFVFGRW